MIIVLLIKTKGNMSVVATHYISVDNRCTSHTFYDARALLLHRCRTSLSRKKQPFSLCGNVYLSIFGTRVPPFLIILIKP